MSLGEGASVLDGYATATPELVERFEALSSACVYEPVQDLLPDTAGRVVNVGAGTGRDAAWFAGQGHQVLAVEPVSPLREAGMALHRSISIEWLDDRLPELTRARRREPFDLVVLSAVWQHLSDNERRHAMESLAALTASGGTLILSLRHGPGAPDRPINSVDPDETIRTARQHGFSLARRVEADSVQAANRANGVLWTWLVLTREEGRG